jgi:hypothetical protein
MSEKEEKMINAKMIKKGDKVEIVIDDEIVEYLYDWAEEWEVKFDVDKPERPLLVIKFFVRER